MTNKFSPAGKLQLFLGLCLLLTHLSCGGEKATDDDSAFGIGDFTFRLERVANNLSFPVAMVFAPDGRLFYNELDAGRTMTLNSSNWNASPQVFCTTPIFNGGERGLIGLESDPNFDSNSYVYMYYTAANGTQNLVDRVTEIAGSCGSRTNLITLTAANNHNGGNIHIGPDGDLYISIGDNENSANAQDLSNRAGKILRINTNGSIPNDNPFVGEPGAAEEIYALGLRNSFDFTFHATTDDLWATENGPSNDDEVNRIVAGENYGWPIVTGIANNLNFTDPLTEYTPTIAPTGIISVATNTVYDPRLTGSLIFADFNDGQLRRLALEAPALQELVEESVVFPGDAEVGALLDIVQGPDGYLYVSSTSAIYRVVQN